MTIDTPQSQNLAKIKRHRNALYALVVLSAFALAMLNSELQEARATLREDAVILDDLAWKNQELITETNRLASQLATVSIACDNYAQEAAQLSSTFDSSRPSWATTARPAWATPTSSDCSVDD